MATSPPVRYQMIKDQFPNLLEAYENLGKATHEGPLSNKTIHLVKLAASGCDKIGRCGT